MLERSDPPQPEEVGGVLPWRFYRLVRVRRLSFFYFGVVLVIVTVGIATGGSLSVTQAVLLASIEVVCLGFVLYSAFRVGVQESADGLSWFFYVWRGRVTWEQIQQFDVMRGGVYPLVVVRRDGRRSSALPLNQGSRVIWDGGSTTDIVSVLTDRANQVRTSMGLAPIENHSPV
jgi:hypothetical protein